MLERLEVSLVDELTLKVVAMEMDGRMSESVVCEGPFCFQEKHMPGTPT